MKVIIFGVRDYEKKVLEEIQREYHHHFSLSESYLNDKNYYLALGYEVVIIRANCNLSKSSLVELKDGGLQFLLTRTVGYNHIPLQDCKDLGIRVAYAPGYSPSSIAELAVGLSLCLLRGIPEAIKHSSDYDFRLNKRMFGKELKDCVVGIIGCGQIGKKAAQIFHGFGAKIFGYDLHEDRSMEGVISYCSLNKLLSQSDIISIHLPYIKGKNDHFIGPNEIERMKDGVVLVNTARGELLDTNALIYYVRTGKIFGAGMDVVENESDVFFAQHSEQSVSPVIKELVRLYPRIIITPHISSSTDSAIYDALRITMNNLEEFRLNGSCRNQLV